MEAEAYAERGREEPAEKCNKGSGALKARRHQFNPEISVGKNKCLKIKTYTNVIQDANSR